MPCVILQLADSSKLGYKAKKGETPVMDEIWKQIKLSIDSKVDLRASLFSDDEGSELDFYNDYSWEIMKEQFISDQKGRPDLRVDPLWLTASNLAEMIHDMTPTIVTYGKSVKSPKKTRKPTGRTSNKQKNRPESV